MTALIMNRPPDPSTDQNGMTDAFLERIPGERCGGVWIVIESGYNCKAALTESLRKAASSRKEIDYRKLIFGVAPAAFYGTSGATAASATGNIGSSRRC